MAGDQRTDQAREHATDRARDQARDQPRGHSGGQLAEAAAGLSVISTRDGSRTLYSAGDQQAFKSEAGALTEARAVYLDGSGVGSALASGRSVRVLEVGFGGGLLFLVTAVAANAAGARLDHVALERRLPPAKTLGELGYADLLAPSELPAALVEWRAGLPAEPEPGRYEFEHGHARLELLVGDARTAAIEGPFDAVYHDAFSPAVNPGLWTSEFLNVLAASIRPGGRLVTFTVAGAVRRALEAAGLSVEKRPGPAGGKREVLVAERPLPLGGG